MLETRHLHKIQDKNPNAVIAVDSLHAATTFEPFFKKKKSNENARLEYINRVTSRTKWGICTATAYKDETTCRITTNRDPHDPEEP